MWTPEQRVAADRSGLRYPSDLTEAEWAIVEPMVPPARQRRAADVYGAPLVRLPGHQADDSIFALIRERMASRPA